MYSELLQQFLIKLPFFFGTISRVPIFEVIPNVGYLEITSERERKKQCACMHVYTHIHMIF
jgi:hypothetical protein